ncbi:MAG: class I SAM-dependent methyltransferase [Lachnospiraceae bacterium]|nr:class I SAM-dependent methyltransferase [Lachnospiraceae bacterium]
MEQSYGEFAYTYDMFMDNIPYKEWGEYLVGLLKENNISDGLIADLGCGTGTITEFLANEGYDMIGIDLSEDMLNVALDKKYESGNDILYLNQDMREFELYGTVRAIVSVCDSMNYILEDSELLQVFKLVNNYLDPAGIFIFDMTTEAKYKSVGEGVIAENREDASFIWENTYFYDKKVNRYDITIFEKGDDGRYDKYEETHYQKVYSVSRVKELLTEAGLEFVAVYNALTHNEPDGESERIYFVAREKQK